MEMKSATTQSTNPVLGWAAMCMALVTWASFSLSMRAIGASALTTGDVALLRFGVPALLLLPLLPRQIVTLRAVPRVQGLMIAVGAGLPFFLLVAAGGHLTSAAHVSALVAGTAPLAVAILSRLLMGTRAGYLPGLAIIIGGIVLLVAGLGQLNTGMIAGAGLLLCGSLLWGTYTLAMRLRAISPLTCLMLVTYPSFVGIVLLMLTGAVETHLASVDTRQIALFGIVQGIGTGLASTLVYTVAVRHLGAIRGATMGALAPAIVTLAAIPLLDEQPSVLTMFGVVTVALGVALANTRQKAGSSSAAAPFPSRWQRMFQGGDTSQKA